MRRLRVLNDGRSIEMDYNSPRISGEVYECGLPLTFDQYSYCSFKCGYCFAAFTKSINMGKGAKSRYDIPVSAVDVEAFKSLFLEKKRSTKGPTPMIQALIANRAPLHWGGLSDPFDDSEREYQVGLEIIRFLTAMRYPTVFSSKGTLMAQEPWRSAFKGGLYRFQHSIITNDPLKAAVVDEGCPTPDERFEAMRVVTREMGFPTTLRLRPIIPGIVTPQQCVELIERAYEAGATGVSTEFMCLEGRGMHNRARYAHMSEAAGMDIYEFYKVNSPGQSGYMRLTPEAKNPYWDAMEPVAKKLGMRFAISDFHGKERNNVTGCCAVYWDQETQANPNYPVGAEALVTQLGQSGHPFINYGTTTKAILIASQRGSVRWSDIEPSLGWADWGINSCFQGFMSNNRERSMNRNKSLKDALRGQWNDPNNSKSLYRYTYGAAEPSGLDENGDIVYVWKGWRAG